MKHTSNGNTPQKETSDWMGNENSEAGVRRQEWNEKMKQDGDSRYVRTKNKS